MPLPVATRNVHIAIVNASTGLPAAGQVQFTLPYALFDSVGDLVQTPGTFMATLLNGEAVIGLPVNDEAGVTPTGWSYEVQVRAQSWVEDGFITVPSGGTTLEFSDIFPSASVIPIYNYATSSQLTAHEIDTTAVHGIVNTADLATLTSPTFTGTVTVNGRVSVAPDDLVDASTIATDASLGNHFRVTLGGNRTLGNPTNPLDGQRIIWELIQDGAGNRTISLDTKFALGADITSIVLSTTGNLRDFLGAIYNQTADRWFILAFVKGY